MDKIAYYQRKMAKKINTKEGLLEYLGIITLPSGIQAIAKIVNDLANENVAIEGEALEALGLAYRGLSSSMQESFELINQQLETRFERIGSRHARQLIALWSEIASYGLSEKAKESLLYALLEKWNDQVKQEKKIFGDIAKIAAVGVVGVVWIAGAAVGLKHARAKTIGDVLATLLKSR